MLPVAFLDSDQQGTQFTKNLRASLYEECPGRVLQVGSYVDIEGAEVEDLIPSEIVVRAVDRMIRDPELPFEGVHDASKPIIPQIEAWAQENDATLEKGWKVELAKRVKGALLEGVVVPPEILEIWLRIF